MNCLNSKSCLGVMYVLALMLTACGGGGDDGAGDGDDGGTSTDDGSTISAPTLTSASTLTEFGNLIQARYASAVAVIPGFAVYLAQFDKSVADFPQALAFTNLNQNPLAGRWTNYPAQTYPNANAKLEFIDNGFGRQRMLYRDLDLTNQLVATGGAQAFYGVGDVEPIFPGSTSLTLPVVAVAEVIVTNAAGVAQYRALKYFEGAFRNYTPNEFISYGWFSVVQGVMSSGPTTSVPQYTGVAATLLQVDHYFLIVLECFVPVCSTGPQLQYNTWILKN